MTTPPDPGRSPQAGHINATRENLAAPICDTQGHTRRKQKISEPPSHAQPPLQVAPLALGTDLTALPCILQVQVSQLYEARLTSQSAS
jgi:hypothetical protein